MPDNKPAWSDLKVAFGFSPNLDGDDLFDVIWNDEDAMASLFPEDWDLVEEDHSGARTVVIFRVNGVPSVEDSHAVQRVLSAIEKGEDPRLPALPPLTLAHGSVELRHLPYGSAWKGEREWFLDDTIEVEVVDSLHRSAGEYGGRAVTEFASSHDIGRAFVLPEHPDMLVFPPVAGRDPREVLLADVSGGEARVVGGLDEWGLYVDEAYRGRGLGGWTAYAGIVLSDSETAGYGLYSEGGYRAFGAAHAIAAGRAHLAGFEVDRNILHPEPLQLPAEREGFSY